MSIAMPQGGVDIPVPEPDPKQVDEEVSNDIVIPAVVSSEEEEEEDEDVIPENHGYQALSSFEVPDLDDSTDEEEETAPPKGETAPREIVINQDLVRSAMKNISIDGSCIPAWAKDISDASWNDLIKKTISQGDLRKDEISATDSGAHCSNDSRPLS